MITTEHIIRQLQPAAWAHSVLEAAKAGWPLPTSTTDLALRLTGDIADMRSETDRVRKKSTTLNKVEVR